VIAGVVGINGVNIWINPIRNSAENSFPKKSLPLFWNDGVRRSFLRVGGSRFYADDGEARDFNIVNGSILLVVGRRSLAGSANPKARRPGCWLSDKTTLKRHSKQVSKVVFKVPPERRLPC
jgi:hypothetical protein